jgi:hypothetical protein
MPRKKGNRKGENSRPKPLRPVKVKRRCQNPACKKVIKGPNMIMCRNCHTEKSRRCDADMGLYH